MDLDKNALRVSEALEYVERESGKHFDPNFVGLLLQVVRAPAALELARTEMQHSPQSVPAPRFQEQAHRSAVTQ